MTIYDRLEMVITGETEEQFKKRVARIRRLSNERCDLEDAIEILSEDPEDAPRLKKKQARLKKVIAEIESLVKIEKKV